jgi:hypothetical protein
MLLGHYLISSHSDSLSDAQTPSIESSENSNNSSISTIDEFKKTLNNSTNNKNKSLINQVDKEINKRDFPHITSNKIDCLIVVEQF